MTHRRYALVRMRWHLSVQTAALHVRLHREHVFLPVPVQFAALFWYRRRQENQQSAPRLSDRSPADYLGQSSYGPVTVRETEIWKSNADSKLAKSSPLPRQGKVLTCACTTSISITCEWSIDYAIAWAYWLYNVPTMNAHSVRSMYTIFVSHAALDPVARIVYEGVQPRDTNSTGNTTRDSHAVESSSALCVLWWNPSYFLFLFLPVSFTEEILVWSVSHRVQTRTDDTITFFPSLASLSPLRAVR